MDAMIELHDSECLAVEVGNDGRGFALLDAYVHRSEGRPGWEAGEGGTQRVRLSFDDMKVDGLVGILPTDIYRGSVEVGDVVHKNLIELEGSYEGAIRFKVMLSEDARILTVSGTRVVLQTESEFCYVELFSPATREALSD